MILYCNFEELAAVSAGGNRLVAMAIGGDHPVLAPPQALADLEALLPRLIGDIEVATLQDQRALERALELLVTDLGTRMDEAILAEHAAAEDAVLAYFDYAHVRSVLDRVERMGAKMEGIIELATGVPADEETARTFIFD
ncbi:MAG TPA: hypothetical protein VF035_08545 [Longimicrobiales bacterium]